MATVQFLTPWKILAPFLCLAVFLSGILAMPTGNQIAQSSASVQNEEFCTICQSNLVMNQISSASTNVVQAVRKTFYEDPNKVLKLPCAHCFHEGCVGPWLKTKGKCCPNCSKTPWSPGEEPEFLLSATPEGFFIPQNFASLFRGRFGGNFAQHLREILTGLEITPESNRDAIQTEMNRVITDSTFYLQNGYSESMFGMTREPLLGSHQRCFEVFQNIKIELTKLEHEQGIANNLLQRYQQEYLAEQNSQSQGINSSSRFKNFFTQFHMKIAPAKVSKDRLVQAAQKLVNQSVKVHQLISEYERHMDF